MAAVQCNECQLMSVGHNFVHSLFVTEQACLLRVYALLICFTRYYESNSTRMGFLKQSGNVFQLAYLASRKNVYTECIIIESILNWFSINNCSTKAW